MVVAAEYRPGSAGWRGRAMVEDALDVLAWVGTHGAPLGLDAHTLVVTGGGSGAHIATVASYLANERARRTVVGLFSCMTCVSVCFPVVFILDRVFFFLSFLPRGDS